MKRFIILCIFFCMPQSYTSQLIETTIELWKTDEWKNTVHPLFLNLLKRNVDRKENLLLIFASKMKFPVEIVEKDASPNFDLHSWFYDKYYEVYEKATKNLQKLLPKYYSIEDICREKCFKQKPWNGDCYVESKNVRYYQKDFPKLIDITTENISPKQLFTVKTLICNWIEKSKLNSSILKNTKEIKETEAKELRHELKSEKPKSYIMKMINHALITPEKNKNKEIKIHDDNIIYLKKLLETDQMKKN